MEKKRDDFSILVSKTLNAIGYSLPIVLLRRDFSKSAEAITNRDKFSKAGMTIIQAGSRREGVCKPLGGDSDQMCVFDGVVCCEDVSRFGIRNNLTVFRVDIEGCYPGYAFLELHRQGERGFTVRDSMLMMCVDNCYKSENGTTYIPSGTFINNMKNLSQIGLNCFNTSLMRTTTLQQRAGPSIPCTVTCNTDANAPQFLYDGVYAFTCFCPSIFEKFRTRRRKHGWPSDDVLRELSNLEAHVVPVGDKSSAFNDLQWRICFTKAEIRLIESLSEPQLHVFVLLKIFSKEVLKPIWDKCTSYLVKNVILWMVELTPARNWLSETIVDRFLNCLLYLKLCIMRGSLPSYMIADRNLLASKGFIAKRKRLVSLLEECLYVKGSCLLRSPTLKETLVNMYSRPGSVELEGSERDQIERAWTSVMMRLVQDQANSELPVYSVECTKRFVLAGNAPELLNLLSKKFTIKEFAKDPVLYQQKMSDMLRSHLT